MHRFAVLFIALNLVLAPLASMVASALGFSGQHVHFEHTVHTAADFARAEAQHVAEHSHTASDQVKSSTIADSSHLGGDRAHTNGPVKHSHPDQVQSVAFVLTAAQQLAMPEAGSATVSAPAKPLVEQQPYPPFRPPQTA